MSKRQKDVPSKDDENCGLLAGSNNPNDYSSNPNDPNIPQMGNDPANVTYNTSTGKSHPLDNCSVFNQMFSFWINPVIEEAKRGELSQEKHYDLPVLDSIEANEVVLEASFNKHRSIFMAIFYAWPGRIGIAML